MNNLLKSSLLATTFIVFTATFVGVTQADDQRSKSDQQTLSSQTFQSLDANSDGVIRREEAAADPMLSEMFDHVDEDGDGRISAEEFSNYMDAGERPE